MSDEFAEHLGFGLIIVFQHFTLKTNGK